MEPIGYFDRLSTFLPVACLPGSLFIAVAKRTRERERKGKIQIASSSHGSTTQSKLLKMDNLSI